jgi:rod shape-determining protein MreC
MDTIFSRYRNLTILAAVLVAQVLVLAVQVKVPYERKPVRLARVWALSLVTPFEKGIVHGQQGITNLWQNYIWLRDVRKENEALRDENERLRLEQIRLAQDAAQAHRLQALLQFKEQTVSETVAAQVIGSSGSETSRTVNVDKGIADGVKTDDAVITPEGVVGKVLKTFNDAGLRHTSQVLLVSDPSSGVGAILENSRLQGILRGTQSGELLLQYVMSDEKVTPGERVLTSGGDRVFPKGMPLGTVTQVSSGPDLFLNIRVKPSAQISRLEEVLVITKVVESAPTDVAASGPVRAADVLAQRLPTIVAQPPSADGAPKHTDPPSFSEWLRLKKQAEKQANAPSATQPFAAPKSSTVPPTSATGTSATNPSKTGGPTAPASAAKKPGNAGEGFATPAAPAPQKKQPLTPGEAGGQTPPASTSQTASPKKTAPKNPAGEGSANPPAPAPQSPPDPSSAKPPRVTL